MKRKIFLSVRQRTYWIGGYPVRFTQDDARTADLKRWLGTGANRTDRLSKVISLESSYIQPLCCILMCLDSVQRRFNVIDGMTGKIFVDFINDPTRNFLMIVFAHFAQRVRRCNNHQRFKVTLQRAFP